MIFSSNTKGAAVMHATAERSVDGECKVPELVKKDDKYEEEEVDGNEEGGGGRTDGYMKKGGGRRRRKESRRRRRRRRRKRRWRLFIVMGVSSKRGYIQSVWRGR